MRSPAPYMGRYKILICFTYDAYSGCSGDLVANAIHFVFFGGPSPGRLKPATLSPLRTARGHAWQS